MINTDTICAIATPSGSGAISIIRISGSKSISTVESLFHPIKKKKSLLNEKTATLHYGLLKDGDEPIDEVLLGLFKNPNSYTGEDSVEISCHGSIFIQQRILQLLLKRGIRHAQPGEFTQRAFLNGKLDLSQAEAVADLIASSSAASHKIAMNQIRGGFSTELNQLRDKLLNFISLIELELDFSEEDVEFANREQLQELLTKVKEKLNSLIKSFKLGNVIKHGVPVAIIGEPNVGKSTLLNALFNEEKAIVSEIAGTTRDSIEDVINIEGIAFRFIDTAGLRETTDTIENLGIERTYKKIELADVVLYLIDAENIETADAKIKTFVEKYPDKKWIFVVNKIDLPTVGKPPSPLRGGESHNPQRRGETPNPLRGGESSLQNETDLFKVNECEFPIVKISAKDRLFIDELVGALLASVNFEKLDESQTIITNVRHYEALTRAYESTRRVIAGIETNISSDFLSQDIREIMHFLGEISGEFSNDEILENIFKNFCIGK